MTQVYLNYINGIWKPSSNEQTFDSKNPADVNEKIGVFPSSTTKDVNEVVASAKDALVEWRELSAHVRGNYLHKAADILESRADDIAQTATREMGKTFVETKGEVLRGVSILRYYAQEGFRNIGENIPSADSKNLLYTMRVPVGVVGVISPWNFPIAIPIWKMAPALVYGNTVVLKPASETAITAIKIIEAFADAGFPKGVINIITGKGSVVGDRIIHHPNVNAVTFTGSNDVGKQVAFACLNRGGKYQLEMGGKNPAIILDDADLDLAAELTVNGAMKHTGQKCTATSRAYIHKDIYDVFKQKVLKKVNAIKLGSGLESDTYMGPVASSSQLDTVLHYIDAGIAEGATLLTGGKVPESKVYKYGYYVEATVFEDVTNDMRIAQEEIFGPVLCLIKVDGLEDALQQANDSRFGLSASLFTNDIGKAFTFINKIEAGLIKVNGESAGVELQAPFGGMKESSSHSREQGQAAKEFFTSIKTITITPIS
ncbi:aldehyde dehydrogenase family protein [Cytobacillus sp. S13-E01]|uniref:alpha-ketoglutaric semialdehyde dehydrogenase GucD n=1 Tax=Cytobacillus sp. S13-E01 TaxID=3031326 RepID=UPI0023D892AA|nr:alpha-ketoglutaric semialdehyde dehydrogenase GucD [Cytobacillus sp. S13-E01]MDF0725965.1 aldehyde dehydrogenase family protein [Cytobacillus sp. S13-E01]